MKKLLLATILSLGAFSAQAAITNVTCDSYKNEIAFTHDSLYNHGWVYVNGKLVDDFWTVSAGSDNFITSLNPNDSVTIFWFNKQEGYGSTSTVQCS